jgi:nitroreductase
MKRKLLVHILVALAISISMALGQAQQLQPINLPQPQKTGGKPLMELLNARKSTRRFTSQKLSEQMLSNLLWAAFGQNREIIQSESVASSGRPGRTAPSGMNLQEIDIYVALAEGVYVYEASSNRLIPVLAKDIRATVNRLQIAAEAAVGLIYVEDTDKRPSMGAGAPPPGAAPAAPGTPSSGTPPGGSPPNAAGTLPAGAPPSGTPQGNPGSAARSSSGEVDSGFIGQNVYLFCASEGLGTFFHATDRDGLAKTLNLRSAQKVLYSQTVGYPAN